MRVAIVGASGVLGRRAVAQARAHGHDVRALVRSGAAAQRVGSGAVIGDVWDPLFLRQEFRRADAVLMLATAIPSITAFASLKAWSMNDRVRAILAPQVAQVARECDVRRLVQESVMLVYGDNGGVPVTERTEPDPAKQAITCLTAEHAAVRFRRDRAGEAESVVLRFALFVAPDSGFTDTTLLFARHGLSPAMGDLEGYVTHIHADDAAAAAVHALDIPSGTYNVGAEPATKEAFNTDLATAVGRSSVRALPGPVRGLLARTSSPLRALARSIRLDSTLLRDTGWQPRYGTNAHVWSRVAGEIQGH